MRYFAYYVVVALLLSPLAYGRPKRNPDSGSSPVFCAIPKSIANIKARVTADDPALKLAMAKLIQEAEETLKIGPFSVVDKTIAPPSGSKHDYMSVGPYWWPDPAREEGLPYIRRDGQINPESETKRSDAPALDRMISSVETLALAFYLSGEEVYAEHAALLLQTWFLNPATKMNPHLQYAQGIPGRLEGRSTGIIDTRNLIQVVDANTLLASSAAWSDHDQIALVAWFKTYLEWLLGSEHGKSEGQAVGNHGTWYDAQVTCYAIFVANTHLAKQIIESNKQRIRYQIQPDGRQLEELARSTSLDYSIFNLKGLFFLAGMGEQLGLDLWYYETVNLWDYASFFSSYIQGNASKKERNIRKALDYVVLYGDPEKTWPHPQIKASVRLLDDMPYLLRRAAIVYGENRYEELLKKLLGEDATTHHRVQLLYPSPRQSEMNLGSRAD